MRCILPAPYELYMSSGAHRVRQNCLTVDILVGRLIHPCEFWGYGLSGFSSLLLNTIAELSQVVGVVVCFARTVIVIEALQLRSG